MAKKKKSESKYDFSYGVEFEVPQRAREAIEDLFDHCVNFEVEHDPNNRLYTLILVRMEDREWLDSWVEEE